MRRQPAVDRQVRIELLRTRAAIEREALARQLIETSQALGPGQLLRATVSSLTGGGKGENSLLSQLMGTAWRHPLLSSALPSLVLGKTGGRRILRVAAIGMAGWQLYKAWKDSRDPSGPEGK